MKIIIVESPGKVAKIQSFLLPLNEGYKVMASVGHIRDIESTKEHKYGVDLTSGGSFAPLYRTIKGKEGIVKSLKTIINDPAKCEMVILAADCDREGEAIAQSCQDLISPARRGHLPTFRISFNQITKSAILKALQNPGSIDHHLVESQLCRRILDRLVGYSLSPLLARIDNSNNNSNNDGSNKRGKTTSIGTGRVQSVIVRLIIERERDIAEQVDHIVMNDGNNACRPLSMEGTFLVKTNDLRHPLHEVTCQLIFDKTTMVTLAATTTTDDASAASATLTMTERLTNKINNDILTASYQLVPTIGQQRIQSSSPPLPFTTSSLGREAYSKLGFSIKKTTLLSQQLYEKGIITYIRTDSTFISKEAIDEIANYIQANYQQDGDDNGGERYSKSTTITIDPTNNNDHHNEGAHEAIRPTKISLVDLSITIDNSPLSHDHQRLYQLIWKRTLASQMANAQYVTLDFSIVPTKATITATPSAQTDDSGWHFRGHLKLLKRAGYLVVNDPTIVDKTIMTAPAANGEIWTTTATAEPIRLIEDFLVPLRLSVEETIPPISSRYNEASLVKQLEKLKIGRPSTYCSLLTKVKDYQLVNLVNEVYPLATIELKKLEGKFRKKTELLSPSASPSALIGSSFFKTETKSIGGQASPCLISSDRGKEINQFLITHFKEIIDYEFTEKMEENLDKIAAGKLERVPVLTSFWQQLSHHLAIYQEGRKKRVATLNQGGGEDGVYQIGRYLIKVGRYGPYLDNLNYRSIPTIKKKFIALKSPQSGQTFLPKTEKEIEEFLMLLLSTTKQPTTSSSSSSKRITPSSSSETLRYPK